MISGGIEKENCNELGKLNNARLVFQLLNLNVLFINEIFSVCSQLDQLENIINPLASFLKVLLKDNLKVACFKNSTPRFVMSFWFFHDREAYKPYIETI